MSNFVEFVKLPVLDHRTAAWVYTETLGLGSPRSYRIVMPFIHVRSLQLDEKLSVSNLVEGITVDFANGTGTALEHVTATWEFFHPGHYAVAGKAAARQQGAPHPVLVDLLAPDFNSPEQVETMLRTVAQSISRRAHIPLDNIFINYRQARAGMVFDAGKVARW